MNNNYIRFLIKSGIKAATAVGALAAAAMILKSDNTGKSDQPKPDQPNPDQTKSEKKTAAEEAAPPKTEQPSNESCAFSESLYPTPNDIYIPDTREAEKAEVPCIELTEKQAVEQGWSFRKKSKSVRITNYHGKERDIIIPSKIGGKRVNELKERAFMHHKTIDRIQIPDSIIKVGKDLFCWSTVREVIFGSGLRVIPEEAFRYCKELSRVILPDTVFEIGRGAFDHCSALEYISFPDSLYHVRENAFYSSGLKGFSMRTPTRLNDGSAFVYTPLHKMYKLIAVRNTDKYLHVLLVGEKAKIKFPKKDVILKDNSVHSDCELDFSECTYLEIRRAFYDEFWFNFNIVVRHGQEGCFFGKRSTVKYTDGSPYPALLKPIKKSGDSLTVEFTGAAFRQQYIPSKFIHFGVKSLKIVTKVFFTLYQHAFDDPKLERLDIDYYFGTNGEIFSYYCTALREVRWKGRYNRGPYIQYIPPAELISNQIHRELLKAFRNTDDWFFDSSVIDNIFSDKRLNDKYMFTPVNPREKIRQQQLILIAIDVLRSTHEQFSSGTAMYSDYLRRHLKYAKKVCEKLKPDYPEYAEFVNNFK